MLGHAVLQWLFGALLGPLLCASWFVTHAQAQEPAPEQTSAVNSVDLAADACGGASNGRAVRLSFGQNVEPGLADAVRADLTEELSRRGIAVCPAEARPVTLLASIRVEVEENARAVLDVSDHATDKQVTRDVSVSHLPDNGRALAIAIAIDELLRASWAELSLAHDKAPVPSEPPPAPVQVTQAVEVPIVPAKKPDKWLSLQGHFAAIPDRYRALGAQLAFDALPWRALWVGARLGAARAADRDVGPGDVSIVALSAGATVGACLEAVRVAVQSCAGASLNVDTLSMRAEAEPGSRAQNAVKPLVSAAATFGLIAPLSERWIATGSVSVGGIVSGVRVTDEARTLLSLEGLVMTAALGLGVSL